MPRPHLLFLLISFLVAAAAPQEAGVPKVRDVREFLAEKKRNERIDPVLAAERDFARLSVEEGIEPAFLEYLADDALQPGPVEGRSWFRDQPEMTGTLSWEPTYAEVSAEGDLAFTMGPYLFEGTKDAKGKPWVVQHGHFVSVWAKKLEGWRVVVDHGINHNEFSGTRQLTTRIPEPVEDGSSWREAFSSFTVMDEKIAGLGTAESLQEAYARYGADDVRLYRRGFFPARGKEQVLQFVASLQTLLDLEFEGGGMSRSRDLAYSFGTALIGKISTAATYRARYLRLWRRGADNEWKLILDLAVPLPEDPEEAQPVAPPQPAKPPAPPSTGPTTPSPTLG
jgi:ketosteroid isomerase-like protein